MPANLSFSLFRCQCCQYQHACEMLDDGCIIEQEEMDNDPDPRRCGSNPRAASGNQSVTFTKPGRPSR